MVRISFYEISLSEELQAGPYLQGTARLEAAPTERLANLFSSRQLDNHSPFEYLAQSNYYKNMAWDIPQDHAYDLEAEQFEHENLEDYEARRPKDPWKGANERLQQRFMDIFDDIPFYFGFSKTRKALATDSIEDEHDDIWYDYDDPSACDPPSFSTRPAIVILEKTTVSFPVHLTRTVEK